MKYLQNVFQGRSFLDCKDYTPAEIDYLIDFALHLKKEHILHEYLKGKNIALLFKKSSTRTRSAFVVACNDLGANPEYMGAGEIHLGKKESIKDTAKVLGSMFDGIEYRGFAQKDVEDLAKYSGVPVWNGLTDKWHPTQMLADFMTIKEKFGHLKGITLAYGGDGRDNVADSLLVAGSMLGVNIHIVTPMPLFTHPDVQAIAAGGGGIPVIVDHGRLKGVAGVIDKDFSAAQMAEDINADELVILTTVDNAYLNYRKEDQQAIGKVTVDQLKQYLNEGHFAVGSMKPKIEAAIEFTEKTGNPTIITSLKTAAKLNDGIGPIVYN